MSTPGTYHDLVIKDGKFIGRFEEMYRQFDDPWRQSEQPNAYSRQCSLLHMRRFGINSVVEFGCGLGYFANSIYQSGILITGYDISSTAIEKARSLFPHLDLRVGRVQDVLEGPVNTDAILFAEIGWYILDDLDRIMDLLLKNNKDLYFINNQVFYKGSQRYGNEFFTDLEEYIERIPLQPLAWMKGTAEDEPTIETSSIFRIKRK